MANLKELPNWFWKVLEASGSFWEFLEGSGTFTRQNMSCYVKGYSFTQMIIYWVSVI